MVIPITIVAYFLNGVAVIIDKVLLTEKIPDPLIYVFYFSAISALALVVLPFTPAPTLHTFLLASTSTLLWTTGAYFMYKGLQVGQVSRVIPVIGSLVPLFLLIYYSVITQTLTPRQSDAAIVLILGLVVLIWPNLRGKLSQNEVKFEILAGFLFAISYIFLKLAYNQSPFLTVLIWSRLILIPVGIILLLIPKLRKIVLNKNGGTPIKIISTTGALFVVGQASGGISQLMLTFAISLGNPAIVNSLQGTQYMFLFFVSVLLFKRYPRIFPESFKLLDLTSKIIGIILIFGGLYLLAF